VYECYTKSPISDSKEDEKEERTNKKEEPIKTESTYNSKKQWKNKI